MSHAEWNSRGGWGRPTTVPSFNTLPTPAGCKPRPSDIRRATTTPLSHTRQFVAGLTIEQILAHGMAIGESLVKTWYLCRRYPDSDTFNRSADAALAFLEDKHAEGVAEDNHA